MLVCNERLVGEHQYYGVCCVQNGSDACRDRAGHARAVAEIVGHESLQRMASVENRPPFVARHQKASFAAYRLGEAHRAGDERRVPVPLQLLRGPIPAGEAGRKHYSEYVFYSHKCNCRVPAAVRQSAIVGAAKFFWKTCPAVRFCVSVLRQVAIDGNPPGTGKTRMRHCTS